MRVMKMSTGRGGGKMKKPGGKRKYFWGGTGARGGFSEEGRVQTKGKG